MSQMDALRGKVVDIVTFVAERRRGPAAEPEEVTLQVVDLGFCLDDVGVARDPLGRTCVTGPGSFLDRGYRVLPMFSPQQARLIAERFLAAARAAECAECARLVPTGMLGDAPPPCRTCGGDV